MPIDERQPAISRISRRSLLRGGLLAGAGVATVGAASAIFTGTAKAGTDPQAGWAYCVFCHNMWWTAGNPNAGGVCLGNPYASVHASGASTYDYTINNNESGRTINTNPQANWTWCSYCESLFWGQANSLCAGNQNFITGVYDPHAVGSSTSYDLYWGLPGTTNRQTGWRWCSVCHVLFYPAAGSANGGTCAVFDHNTGEWLQHQGGTTVYDASWSGFF